MCHACSTSGILYYVYGMASSSHTGPAASIPVDLESFKSVLTSVLSKKDFNLRSERCTQLQEFGKRLLACLSNPANSSILATFIQKLNLLFDTALPEIRGHPIVGIAKIFHNSFNWMCTFSMGMSENNKLPNFRSSRLL